MRIQVALHKDRTVPGSFQVLADADSTVLFGPVPCLGKADNQDAAQHQNPTRDPKRPFGDTPTGGYNVAAIVSHQGETDLHTYGAFPSLLLDPQSGDALTAKQNGREGIMIHGGAPSATGGLRPTHGCIRLSEASQQGLTGLVASTPLNSLTVSVSEA
ncbi:MAG TPA: L,D-transpeptidase [Bryobacteraceae bacterium]|nr:L,D-transpeptidase [Bryobacteraceae bacterium]